MQDIVKLKEKWKASEKEDFTGWDFSKLNKRWISKSLPWDYKSIIRTTLNRDSKLLDIDTGGGEFLLSLCHNNKLTYVTEGYQPNVDLCKKRLSPLGITVVEVKDNLELPFENNYFDIIICKHGEYSFKEIYRILKPGGNFITQQVGGCNNNILSRKLIRNFVPKYEKHNLKNNTVELKKAGFKILYSNEVFNESRFLDIEALIYFAKIIEWEFPGFSIDNCFNELLEINNELNKNGFIYSEEHRFIINVMK